MKTRSSSPYEFLLNIHADGRRIVVPIYEPLTSASSLQRRQRRWFAMRTCERGLSPASAKCICLRLVRVHCRSKVSRHLPPSVTRHSTSKKRILFCFFYTYISVNLLPILVTRALFDSLSEDTRYREVRAIRASSGTIFHPHSFTFASPCTRNTERDNTPLNLSTVARLFSPVVYKKFSNCPETFARQCTPV